MTRRDRNPQGRTDSFKPTCIVIVVLVLALLAGIVVWIHNTIKHGWDEVQKKASESSSLHDLPSDVLNQLAPQGGVPPCWELSQQGATRCS